MKITCDLCGGPLQINAGGKNASCTECGMLHSMERVREKIKTKSSNFVDEPATVIEPVTRIEPIDIIDATDIIDANDIMDSGDIVAPISADEPITIVEPIEVIEPIEDNRFQMTIDKISSTLGKGIIVHGKVKNGSIFEFAPIYVLKRPSISGTVQSIKYKNKLIKKADVGMNVELSIRGIKRKELSESDILTDTKLRPGVPAEDGYAYNGTPEEYFTALFQGIFSKYEIRQNVAVPEADCAPISYLFINNKRPVLAVLLCESNHYKRKNILNTIQVCESKGIPVQRYYTNFRNESEYVIERIQSVLN